MKHGVKTSKEEIKKMCEEKDFEFVDILYSSNTEKSTATIKFICNKHKYIGVQERALNRFKSITNGCYYCSHVVDTYTFKEKLSKKGFLNIDVIGNFVNQNTPIELKCVVHNCIYEQRPRKIFEGNVGCPKCKRANNQNKGLLTKEEFVARMKKDYPMIQVIGNYVDSTTKVQLYCKEHNCYYEKRPSSFLYKHVQQCCPKCFFISSNEDFVEKLKEINPHIKPLENYTGMQHKVKCNCVEHGLDFYARPSHMLFNKTGCRKCNKYTNELKISDLLSNWGFDYTQQKRFDDCKDCFTLPFDFFLNDCNIAIEYDGEQHYKVVDFSNNLDKAIENFKVTQKHDLIKTEYCKTHKIKLIRIPYWEKDDDNLEYFLYDQLVKYKAIQTVA